MQPVHFTAFPARPGSLKKAAHFFARRYPTDPAIRNTARYISPAVWAMTAKPFSSSAMVAVTG
jgi:hypothetical protein